MRGRSWVVRWWVSVCAEVGPQGSRGVDAAREGVEGPWCLERTVREGAGVDEEVVGVEDGGEREEKPVRRGWRARKAMKGYVVA